MTEQLAKQEILKVTSGCVDTHGEHNLEDESGEDTGSDYVSAGSDAEDDQKKVASVRNEKRSVLSNSAIKRHSQPASIVIPPTEELEMPGDSSDRCTFVPTHPGLPVMPSVPPQSPQEKAQVAAKEGKLPHTVNIGVTTPPHKPAELISGVYYQAQYLGSTFIFVPDSCEGVVWTQHAHEVIGVIKQPADERQPHFAVSLKISSENLAVINCLSNVELMSFHLCAVSFVTDVGDLLVIMVRRDHAIPGVAQNQQQQASKTKISCHVLQAPNVCVVSLMHLFTSDNYYFCRLA